MRRERASRPRDDHDRRGAVPPPGQALRRSAFSGREFELERTQTVARPLEETFAFFSDPWNLETITPPWLRFSILEAPSPLAEGARLVYRLALFGVRFRWHARIARWRPPRSFTDVQVVGPYVVWEHTHRFSPVESGTEIYDHVRYRLPGGPLAPLVHRALVGRWLEQIFDYRAARLSEVLTLRAGSSTSNPKRSA